MKVACECGLPILLLDHIPALYRACELNLRDRCLGPLYLRIKLNFMQSLLAVRGKRN